MTYLDVSLVFMSALHVKLGSGDSLKVDVEVERDERVTACTPL
jgi:hypothetical protein